MLRIIDSLCSDHGGSWIPQVVNIALRHLRRSDTALVGEGGIFLCLDTYLQA